MGVDLRMKYWLRCRTHADSCSLDNSIMNKESKTGLFLQTIQRKLAGKRISGGLITLSSAAIFAVYAAGYEQTKAAADRFTEQAAQRVAGVPVAEAFEQTATVASLEPAPLSLPPSAGSSAAPAILASARMDSVSPVAVSTQSASDSAAISNGTSSPAVPPGAEAAELPGSKPAAAIPVVEPIAVAVEPRMVELPVPAAAPVPPPAARQSLYKDGSYQGWGTSRHGDIEVTVVIQDGRIATAAISQCRTRYPCSWISQLPGQVVSRQSPNVDYVSGATQSVNAYYSAVIEALTRAK
jgi:uncharacterized protein with FMN-binding domain